MRKHFLSLLFFCFSAALAATSGSAQQVFSDLSSQPTGRIYFNSATPKSKWELVHRKYDKKPTVIWGTLYMPENTHGRIPAMVISHGSAGVGHKEADRWARAFNSMGIAAFIVDSFGGRGITSTMDDQSLLSSAANDADALFALKLLSTDPRIDPAKIGQIGFSRGGAVALDMVLESFRKSVIDDDTHFAALVGFYLGCVHVWWEIPAPPLTGAPLMLALGEKDDYTPAKGCLNFADIMKRDGQALEVHVYPGSYHDFDNTRQYFKYFPSAMSTKNCPQVIFDIQHGGFYHMLTGEKYPYNAMMADYNSCITRGASTGANLQQGDRAEADVKAFLIKAMAL